ncbi:hypothetical protein [Micromonospora sp. NPDC048839]|uniref:hypothetical protein n=1 Tax=Micromonospora sp. NPDC048839 TaxID=3155641 RepID=UPI0033D5DA44
MGFQFAKPSEFAGGTFFKPLEHMNDLALLIEPKRIDRNVESTYNNVTRVRDEVTADITVFGTSEALEKGVPTAVIKSARVTHGMLTSTLEKIMGGAMVGVVAKVPTKAGSGYAFRDVSAAIEGQVGTYYGNREAAVSEALASGAMPSFDA